MIISVDAAGGDFYPDAPVAGAVEAVHVQNNLKVMLCGPQAMIEETLSEHQYPTDQILIQHAPQIIGMDEIPAQAVKTKQNSSVATALELQKRANAGDSSAPVIPAHCWQPQHLFSVN